MKLSRERLEERDAFRLALINTYESTLDAIYGPCRACRNLALAALELADWSLPEYLLVRPLWDHPEFEG